MIKACEDVVQAAGWMDQLLKLDAVSNAENGVITAIGHQLAK